MWESAPGVPSLHHRRFAIHSLSICCKWLGRPAHSALWNAASTLSYEGICLPYKLCTTYSATYEDLSHMLEELQAEAQQVLDELFNQRLLPFKLCAYRIESIGLEEYRVRFYDSRLRSVAVSWPPDQSFKGAFRAAVLCRVKRVSGPLPLTHNQTANQ